DLAGEDAKFQQAISTAKLNYEKRKTRLGKAYRSSKELGLTRIEDRTGQRKYALQRQMLQAERDRDAGLANNAAALEEFRKDLAAEQDALNTIEATARGSFQGYRKWLRLLSRSEDSPRNDAAREQLRAELRDTLGKARAELGSF